MNGSGNGIGNAVWMAAFLCPVGIIMKETKFSLTAVSESDEPAFKKTTWQKKKSVSL